MGVVTALMGPLVMAIVQDMVSPQHLPRAVTLYSIALNGGRAVGPAAAGFLIAKAGVAAAFASNALAYAAFAVTLWLWRAPQQVRAVERGVVQALLGGLRHAAHDETFRTLLTRLLLFLVSASGLLAITPLVAHARIDASPQAFGAMTAGIGLGALAGAFGRGFIAARWPALVRVEACSILVALAYFGLAVCHGLPAAFACVVIFGIGWTNAAISFQSLAQLSLPPELRGRGIAIYLTIFALGTLLGGLAAGFVVDRLGVGVSLALAGACAVVLDRAVLLLGRLWRSSSERPQGT
jgi:predicted MFS family arabinose efflux permease